MSEKYLEVIKSLVLAMLKTEELKIILFGSRARGDHAKTSDVDIGLIPQGPFDQGKITLLKEKLEDLNVPYKIEIVNFDEVSDDFKKEAMKKVVVWKD